MEISNLRIETVHPSPMNPRKEFDEESLKELADNIARQGLLQPITVRPSEWSDEIDIESGVVASTPVSYEIVCGERRYRACLLNGSGTIASIVRQMTDDEAFDAMVTENLQRRDVSPFEEAFAFQQLSLKGATAEEIALRFGKSPRFVLDRIKLNSLIPELRKFVKDGKMSLAAAMIMSKLDEGSQRKFAKDYSNSKNIDKAAAAQYAGNLFCNLTDSPWAESDPDFAGGCGISCKQCPCNSANVGCLFYGSDIDKGASCTCRPKMIEKSAAWLKRALETSGLDFVRNGERHTKDKVCLIDLGPSYSLSDTYERGLKVAEELGLEVIPNLSAHLCRWYRDNDDPRTREGIESGRIRKYLRLMLKLYGKVGGFKLEPEYFYSISSSETAQSDPEEGKAKSLAFEYSQVERRVMAPLMEALLKKLNDIEPTSPYLSSHQMSALAVVALFQLSNEVKMSLGIKSLGSDEIWRIAQDREKRVQFIWKDLLYRLNFHILGGGYSSSASSAVLALAQETITADCEQTVETARKEIKKRQDKIRAKLEALGYGVDGEKLEFGDNEHYTSEL